MIEQILIQALAIAIPVVYIIDFAGIAEKLKRFMYYRKYTNDSPYIPYSLKPFDCSGCLSVWLYWIVWGAILYTQASLNIYLLVIGGFTAGLLAIALRKYIIF